MKSSVKKYKSPKILSILAKRNALCLVLIIMTICSCSRKNNLYLTRTYLPNYKIGDVIVSMDGKRNASVTIIRREKSEIIKDHYNLKRKSKNKYESDGMTLIANSKMASIQWAYEDFTAHRVQRKTKETTLSNISSKLSENYIVWLNEHQMTQFDLRADSMIYIYRNAEKEPYETIRWFLLSIDNEYFLSYSDHTNNSVPRIQIRNGKMYETSCQKSGCKERVMRLMPKRE